jgi:hypothetical protein
MQPPSQAQFLLRTVAMVAASNKGGLMDSLNKIATDGRAWLGVLALALTIAVELLAEGDTSKASPASFAEREKVRRAKDNLDWLTR